MEEIEKLMSDSINKLESLKSNEIEPSHDEYLLGVFNEFQEWHKKQGFMSLKSDDFEEFLIARNNN